MHYLYLHVPFCSSICYYCDFKRNIYQESSVNAWLKEINNECKQKIKDKKITTIYLGGGTPSCLNEEQLECLLTFLDEYRENVLEYTVESNIESLTQSKVEIMKRHGVNRISLGVQSLQDSLLTYMNRKHRKKDVLKMLDDLHSWGMDNISVDFIYGFR
ncbi:MAG: radical SAM protein [Erysipelotrichia bacterium]|nr:radical SAM protein [Erysipelotrichia bacterium]